MIAKPRPDGGRRNATSTGPAAHKLSLDFICNTKQIQQQQPQRSRYAEIAPARAVSVRPMPLPVYRPCGVCRRPQCALKTHRDYLIKKRTSKLSEGATCPDVMRTSFASSYALHSSSTTTKSWSEASEESSSHALSSPRGKGPEITRPTTKSLNGVLGVPFISRLTVNSVPEAFSTVGVSEIDGLYLVSALTNGSVCLSILAREASRSVPDHHHRRSSYLSPQLRQFVASTSQSALSAAHDNEMSTLVVRWSNAIETGEPDALRQCAGRVRSVVTDSGGLAGLSVDAVLRQQLIWADLLTAAQLGQDLYFKDINPPQSLPPSFHHFSRMANLEVPSTRSLQYDVKQAAYEMRFLLLVKDAVVVKPAFSLAEYKYLLSHLNHSALSHVALEVKYHNSRLADETVTIAMNILRFLAFLTTVRTMRVLLNMLGRLQSAIQGRGIPEKWATAGQIDLLTWACSVAIVVPVPLAHRDPFVVLLSQTLKLKYGNKWPANWMHDTQRHLRNFLWLDQDFTTPLVEGLRAVEKFAKFTGVVIGKFSVDDEDEGIGSSISDGDDKDIHQRSRYEDQRNP